MFLEVGTGSDFQVLAIKDSISSQRGSGDGLSFCGERTYQLTNNKPWLTLVGSTLTINSSSIEDTQEVVESQIIVTLVRDSSIVATIDFEATIYSDDPNIATRIECNSVSVLRPNQLEDMQIAYGSDLRVIQKIDSLKDLNGDEVADECQTIYEIEYLPLHTYLRLNPTQTRIVLKSPTFRQESLISYNTPEEATLVIKNKNSQ